MAHRIALFLDRVLHRQTMRRLQRAVAMAPDVELADLRGLRSRGRELRNRVDRLLRIADGRLALPLVGSQPMTPPLHSDWSYRPELWRVPIRPSGIAQVGTGAALGSEIVVFHDCSSSDLTIRQTRNTRDEDMAPFGMRLDVLDFDGGFLSLVVQLPAGAVSGLKRRHLIQMAFQIELEHPLELFARLNIKHGPNTEQLVRELPLDDNEVVVDFDLAYSNLNEKQIERAWLDLIFEGPRMNRIDLRDLTMSRRPRSEV